MNLYLNVFTYNRSFALKALTLIYVKNFSLHNIKNQVKIIMWIVSNKRETIPRGRDYLIG